MALWRVIAYPELHVWRVRVLSVSNISSRILSRRAHKILTWWYCRASAKAKRPAAVPTHAPSRKRHAHQSNSAPLWRDERVGVTQRRRRKRHGTSTTTSAVSADNPEPAVSNGFSVRAPSTQPTSV